ncbi:hypothetical protein TNIN_477901 [Trichonephila inaurata madagascariensis]|uniref:Uncharacterized protein n=1 Tax=Trichonephila inaurata madagascariensis TaxID=2747483 RepID=A0A8X7C3S9_9ARAC|nr:hypothetical protein TNIN_477901 [Trichonephila inaurata madagascariensis]
MKSIKSPFTMYIFSNGARTPPIEPFRFSHMHVSPDRGGGQWQRSSSVTALERKMPFNQRRSARLIERRALLTLRSEICPFRTRSPHSVTSSSPLTVLFDRCVAIWWGIGGKKPLKEPNLADHDKKNPSLFASKIRREREKKRTIWVACGVEKGEGGQGKTYGGPLRERIESHHLESIQEKEGGLSNRSYDPEGFETVAQWMVHSGEVFESLYVLSLLTD